MTQVFNPGQKVYLLYWRRRDEDAFTRMQIFTAKRRRDNANIDYIAYGMITLTAEWEIPLPFSSPLKEVKLIPNCPKCGATMERLRHGDKDDEWVCPNHCDSKLDEVLKRAEKMARDVLDDDDQYEGAI